MYGTHADTLLTDRAHLEWEEWKRQTPPCSSFQMFAEEPQTCRSRPLAVPQDQWSVADYADPDGSADAGPRAQQVAESTVPERLRLGSYVATAAISVSSICISPRTSTRTCTSTWVCPRTST